LLQTLDGYGADALLREERGGREPGEPAAGDQYGCFIFHAASIDTAAAFPRDLQGRGHRTPEVGRGARFWLYHCDPLGKFPAPGTLESTHERSVWSASPAPRGLPYCVRVWLCA